MTKPRTRAEQIREPKFVGNPELPLGARRSAPLRSWIWARECATGRHLAKPATAT
jgi:hypothetical protein